MKKLLLLSASAFMVLASANAQSTTTQCNIMGDFKNNEGYKFEYIWGSDALVGNGNIRAGVGYADKFYFADNVNNNVPVYGKKGLEKTMTVNGNVWVSATADDAGHVMIRSTTNDKWPSDGAYAGAYYPEDGHILTIIDATTGEIINAGARMDDGRAFRFDALGHINGDVTKGWWEVVGCGDGEVCNDFMFDGIDGDCAVGCETFALTLSKAFANSGAGAGKSTGCAQIFGDPDEDGNYTNMAVYCNPVVGITGFNTEKGLGNGIQLYRYTEDEDGVAAWRATDKFFATPQHSSHNGFVIFRLKGVDFIAYTSGESAGGVQGANAAASADAMAIAKVKYIDTPVSPVTTNENGILVDDTSNLVARMFGAMTDAGAPIYKPGSNFTCFNVEYIPNEDNAVYIYQFCQGAPMIKTKFTVPADLDSDGDSDGVAGIFADEDENAPVVYYNLQGVRVDNPQGGLFIKQQGTKAVKVIR